MIYKPRWGGRPRPRRPPWSGYTLKIMNRPLLMFVLAACPALCHAQIPAGSWDNADRQVVRLQPKAFPELPSNLRAELERRGCTIPQVPPQVSMIAGRQNVIKGEFSKPGQTDWAVLCSIGRVSSILIFWNGSVLKPAEIERAPDQDRLQGWGGDKIVYSRAITPVGAKFITEHYNAYGGENPPPLDHQGIDDAFVGKASVVLYLYRGKWLHLSGAD
jgi:hypothetical protein